jgi:hypothetical protein
LIDRRGTSILRREFPLLRTEASTDMPGMYHPDTSSDRRFPYFEKPALPCPTSVFRAFVKQVNPSTLSSSERNFLNAAFGGFLTGVKPPGRTHALLAAFSLNVGQEDRLPRRYDGDRTLPHGRYYTICEDAEGNDSGTLVDELIFYTSARIAEGHIEVFDPTIDSQREMIGLLGMSPSARERIVVRFTPFAQDAHATMPLSFTISIPVIIQELQVNNVLDLRRPLALDWIFRTIPNLHFILNDNKAVQPCFPFRAKLTEFGNIIPSLVDQQRGGGNFDKLVGLYLRQLGVSGLVFPSARNDAYTYAVNGEPQEFHGWSFVDYRDAPSPEIVAFFELRPEWPRTLMIEGGDDNDPRAAAFAEEFSIVMTENFQSTGGTLWLRGLAQRIKAYHIVDSLEAAARFRFPDLSNDEWTKLLTFIVSLGSRDAINFASMVLYSLLGMEKAQNDLKNFIGNQLGEHPIAELLTRCVKPPAIDEKKLADARAFRAVFES